MQVPYYISLFLSPCPSVSWMEKTVIGRLISMQPPRPFLGKRPNTNRNYTIQTRTLFRLTVTVVHKTNLPPFNLIPSRLRTSRFVACFTQYCTLSYSTHLHLFKIGSQHKEYVFQMYRYISYSWDLFLDDIVVAWRTRRSWRRRNYTRTTL